MRASPKWRAPPCVSYAMDRRAFLQSAAAASAGVVLPFRQMLLADTPPGAGWRTFELTTRVEVLQLAGRTRVWLPTPLTVETPYQKSLGNLFSVSQGGEASIHDDVSMGLGVLAAAWPEGAHPVLTLTSHVSVKDYAVDVAAPPRRHAADRSSLAPYLRPTKLVPIDGIVKTTSDAISRGAASDLEKARAIYDWTVENTFRDPKTRGCGMGDIRFMLESKNLSGKCADLKRACTLVSPAPPVCRRATCTAFGWRRRRADSRAWALRRRTSPVRNTAAPRCSSTGTAGRRSIRGCTQSRAGGAARSALARLRPGGARPRSAVRLVGDELGGVQLRPRRRAAGRRGRRRCAVLHVPAVRDGGRPSLSARPGPLPLRNHRARCVARVSRRPVTSRRCAGGGAARRARAASSSRRR